MRRYPERLAEARSRWGAGMRIELNGEARELADGATLADAVRAAGGTPEARGVAVALDGEVVPRGDWEETRLAGGAEGRGAGGDPGRRAEELERSATGPGARG